ncbi:hypothetical protein [Achromobacter deleyi]|nr:hypothetical protein [Achromobacter deleyi]
MMKKTTAPTPPDLAGANVAYCKRLAELAQESQQRWLQLGQRLAGDTAGQYFASFGPLKVDGNWQKIAPALGEATRKHWQCQLEASQAITHAALEDQAALAAGVSEAFSGWLSNASAAATGGLTASPLTRMWSSFSEQMTSACTAMQEATQVGARHGR